VFTRRPRYSGKNPRGFRDKYKELNLTKLRLSRNGRIRDGTIAKGLGHVRGLDHGRLL